MSRRTESPESELYDEYARHCFERAVESFKSAVLNFCEENFNPSVSRAYYAVYHVARGLIALKGVCAKRHDEVRGYFYLLYIKTGEVPDRWLKTFTDMGAERIKADFVVPYRFSSEEAAEALRLAYEFLEVGEDVFLRLRPGVNEELDFLGQARNLYCKAGEAAKRVRNGSSTGG